MISKAKIKFVRSLEQKKNRKSEKVFVAEGVKGVGDIMKVLTPRIIVAVPEWIEKNRQLIPSTCELYDVTEDELKKISFLQTPQQVLAVFPQKSCEWTCQELGEMSASQELGSGGASQEFLEKRFSFDTESLYLALDGVQDPGNLGTIIRIADWFGITQIFCSQDSADVWNPKVVQATMGSIARVNVSYVSLERLLDSVPKGFPVYGTFLDGEDIHSMELENRGIIVMGNEGKGISDAVRQRVSQKLFIPNYPAGRESAESLNVAIATAITCFAIRR